MTKVKAIGVVGALLVGASTLAVAQTNSTAPGSMSPTVTQPQSGSHPTTGTPQAAPQSRTMGSSSATTPGQQTARGVTEQDVKKRLEDAGYSSVTNIKPSHDGYSARAMMSGKRVTVDVDGNGQIMAK